MKYKNLSLIFTCLIVFSCDLKPKVYENEYLKLDLPEGWAIKEQNDSDKFTWLSTVFISLDSSYLDDRSNAHGQNLIIVASDSVEVERETGYFDFTDYGKYLNNRQKERSYTTSEIKYIYLGTKGALYWQHFEKNLIQKCYMVHLGTKYVSFILTHSDKGRPRQLDEIMKSIVFKK